METRLNVSVKSACVVTGVGTDRISIVLDLPTPYPVMGYEACAKIETAEGYGVKWCRDNLGIDPEVIYVRLRGILATPENV